MPKEKLYAICSGDDWTDAGVDHLIVPDNLDIDEEKRKRKKWYREGYCPNIHTQSRVKYISFTDWLLKAGARMATEEEVIIWWNL